MNDPISIEFINHAGFIVRSQHCSVCTDPWLVGDAFDGCWSLVSPTQPRSLDFAEIDYICFTHDHPDHLSLASLSTIPLWQRKNITLLTKGDGISEVEAVCDALGFKGVSELSQQPLKLAADFSISSAHFRAGDSWVRYLVGNLAILNTNDCAINDEVDAAKIGRWNSTTNVLMTKFSYSSWAGNPDQSDFRKSLASSKYAALELQAKHFKPDLIIPIGNHAYFSHVDNFYLNDELNSPADAFRYIRQRLQLGAALLYPGEVWRPSQNQNYDAAVARYDLDYKALSSGKIAVTGRGPQPAWEKLALSASEYVAKKRIDWGLNDSTAEVQIQLMNCPRYHLQLSNISFEILESETSSSDVSMTAASFLLAVGSRYGFENVRLGGCMRELKPGGMERCSAYFLGREFEPE